MMLSQTMVRGFKSRYPHLKTRKTTLLDIRRMLATQPEIVQHCFKLLKEQYDTTKYTRDQVWALDETELLGVLKKRGV